MDLQCIIIKVFVCFFVGTVGVYGERRLYAAFQMSKHENKNSSELLLTNGMYHRP